MLNRELHVEPVHVHGLALPNAKHAVDGLLLRERRVLRFKHNDVVSTDQIQAHPTTLDRDEDNVVVAITKVLEALLAFVHAHLAVEHRDLVVPHRLELFPKRCKRRHPRAKHDQLFALGNRGHNIANLVELGIDAPIARSRVGVVTHAAQIDDVAEKPLAVLAVDRLHNHLALLALVLGQLLVGKLAVNVADRIRRHRQNVLGANVDVALVHKHMGRPADKGLETKQVVRRVPNGRSREAPLGRRVEIVDDLEPRRPMVANLVGLVEENAGPREVENTTNVLAAIRNESVVRRNHHAIVVNVRRTLGCRVSGEIVLVNFLDIACKFLAPLLDEVVRHDNQVVAQLVARLIGDMVEHVDRLAEAHVVGQDATARLARLLRRHPIDCLGLVVVELNLGRETHLLRFSVPRTKKTYQFSTS